MALEFSYVRDKLWYRIIVSKYGHIGQGGESGNREGSFSVGSKWWRDLGSLGIQRAESLSWFSSGVAKLLGNGESTFFWHDIWIGSEPLSIKHSRLYSISTGKEKSVQELGRWEGNQWHWELPWRRQFFEWERQLYNNFMADLEGIQPRRNIGDS